MALYIPSNYLYTVVTLFVIITNLQKQCNMKIKTVIKNFSSVIHIPQMHIHLYL